MTMRPSSEAGVVMRRAETLGEMREVWTRLAAGASSIFATWEWASIWREQLGRQQPLLLHTCEARDGRVAAVLPLYEWSRHPFRIARFLGHGPADELGPVCAPSDRPLAAEALMRVVDDERLDLLLVELLPDGRSWDAVLGGRALVRESGLTASLDGGCGGYLSRRRANFRQQLRRRERTLAHRYAVRFRLTDDADRLDEDLSLLYSLHDARWGGRSAFLRWRAFHRQFAAAALDRGWLRLWFLELDGRPAAAWYGFRFNGVESYYQAGRDPQWSDDSVGFLLLAHSIREAATDGMQEYRFLRGSEQFKRRFADEDPGLETVAVFRGSKGRLAAAVVAAAVRSGALHRLRGLINRGSRRG